MWSTCGIKVFLPGNHHVRTLQDISVLCGTLPGGEARGLNPICPVEFLSRLPNWRAMIINRNLSPMVVKIRPSWRRTRTRLHLAPPPPELTLVAPPPLMLGHRNTVPISTPWPAPVNPPPADDDAAA